MSRPIVLLALLACLSSTSAALAQPPPNPEAPASPGADTTRAEHGTDIGTLQAELAQVEAERQRLADQLAEGTDSELLTRLQRENRELLAQQTDDDATAGAHLEAQRQEWFMIGGGTVLLSLVVGFVLASMGRRSKRNEWVN